MERSYWQPEPANGYVTIHLTPGDTGSGTAAMGVQCVAPGGRVREHAHVAQEEIIFVLSGRGTAVLDDGPRAMVPGSAFFLHPGQRHAFVNDGEEDLVFTWTIMPGHGLHEFFASIGRPRVPGTAAPAPFARPAEVAAIESRNGFVPPAPRA